MLSTGTRDQCSGCNMITLRSKRNFLSMFQQQSGKNEYLKRTMLPPKSIKKQNIAHCKTCCDLQWNISTGAQSA